MSNLPRGKNADYWDGFDAEARRSAMRGSRGALDAHDLATEVAKQFGRDNARKQRILARSPHLAYALDAGEFEGMSALELAMRELKEIGHDPGQNDPIAILDAHHAGRKHARDQLANIGSVKGGAASFNRLIGGAGGASDAREGGKSIVDKYLESNT